MLVSTSGEEKILGSTCRKGVKGSRGCDENTNRWAPVPPQTSDSLEASQESLLQIVGAYPIPPESLLAVRENVSALVRASPMGYMGCTTTHRLEWLWGQLTKAP